jgi:hypothetical protein
VTVDICTLVAINVKYYINSLSNKTITISRNLDRQQITYTHVYILICVYNWQIQMTEKTRNPYLIYFRKMISSFIKCSSNVIC